MLTTVPFSGFYESLHDGAIDDCLQQMFADDHGNVKYPKLAERLQRDCDFRKVHLAYAQAYVEAFADEVNLKTLKWESLTSPREYNFETDRLFATMDEDEFLDLIDSVELDKFHALARHRFTSRDGFMSWYDPDVSTWGPSHLWDHNQVGCLLQAHANEQHGGYFDHWAEYGLCQDFDGSGRMESWIGDATPSISRLYKIYNYLEARALR